MLDNSLTLSRLNFVLYQWVNKTLCVSYFTEMVSGSSGNGPVNKKIHYVLDILLSF